MPHFPNFLSLNSPYSYSGLSYFTTIEAQMKHMGRLFRAAAESAKETVLFDMDEAARASGSILNAVLLGAIAGSGKLPIAPERFAAAVGAVGAVAAEG